MLDSESDSFFDVLQRFVPQKDLAVSSFHHVIDEILEYDLDGVLPLSLIEHFGTNVNVIDLLSLYQEDIDNLFYYDKSTSPPTKTCVRHSARRKLEFFIDFAQQKYDMGFDTFDNWLKVT